MDAGLRCVLWVLLAWLLPPIAVGLVGGCTVHLLLNIVLLLLFYLPGRRPSVLTRSGDPRHVVCAHILIEMVG